MVSIINRCMRACILLVALTVPFSQVLADPTLQSADIVVIARNTDLDDQFALIALADIPGGSVIFITDEGYDEAGSFLTAMRMFLDGLWQMKELLPAALFVLQMNRSIAWN
ncbi:MAG: hypothetical protein MI866_11795 [Bacteroidales bacterium]|nr:hypothetical protein [Bacteroidales bacterium]